MSDNNRLLCDNTENRSGRGIFLLIISALLFAVMAIAVRLAGGQGISGAESSFVRFAFGLALVTVLHITGLRKIKPNRIHLLAARGITGGFAILLYFMSLSSTRGAEGTPLTNSVLLGNSYFIFAPVFGAVFIKEKIRVDTVIMVVLSLYGMYLVVQPDFSSFNPGNLYGLLSGVIAALSIVILRELRKTESSYAIFFSLSAFGLIVSFAVMLFQGYVIPDRDGWLILIIIGITGTAGQLLLTYSLRFTGASESSLLSLTTVVYTTIAGVLWFGDPFNRLILTGIIIVLGSGAYISIVHSKDHVCQ
ncbi:MAG: DMT family transporter [Armatimonadota bacterium]